MSFKSLGLSADIMRAVEQQGFKTATPVQMKSIPVVLDRHDLMAQAQTGTGKTAAFALPILQRLCEIKNDDNAKGKTKLRALVLTPTRELAAQVGSVFSECAQNLPIKSTVIFGGVGMGKQRRTLEQGVDIVVATPGRLLDHLNQGSISLKNIQILTLDEADRMLDMGFIRDIRRLIGYMPERSQRQNLLFSATFSKDIIALAKQMLNNPERITIGTSNSAAERVQHRVHPVSKSDKSAALSHLIHEGNYNQVLVFTRTKHGADRLVRQLGKAGLPACAIHGNKSQGARTRALAQFKDGTTQILVATDIAARGIDINQLPYVVNYELPNVPEDYVHRIGRTARAGNSGLAISLVDHEEEKFLRDIEALMKCKIERQDIDGFKRKAGPVPAKPARGGRPNGAGAGRNNAGASSGGGQRRRRSKPSSRKSSGRSNNQRSAA